MQRLGKILTVRFGANGIEAQCVGVAEYTNRVTQYLFEWIDSTGRPVREWVDFEQIDD